MQLLIGLLLAVLTSTQLLAFDRVPAGGARDREIEAQSQDVVSDYQMVGDAGRPKVRLIVTSSRGSTAKLPALYLAPWLSCDSVEYKDGPSDAIGSLLLGLVQAGYLLGRTEKPGINGSEGTCADADFHTELAGYRAGFRAFLAHPRADPARIYILGLSNGAAYAPLVAGDTPVRAYVVSGGWAKTWFEHMIEVERKLMTLRGVAPVEITRRMKLFSEFYAQYLLRQKTPGAVLAERPYLKEIWDDDPDHQYGRAAAFHHQLQKLNIAEVWSKVQVPVFAIYGEYDQLMVAEDHATLAEWANQRVPGSGRFVIIPKTSHGLALLAKPSDVFASGPEKFSASSLDLIVAWLKEH